MPDNTQQDLDQLRSRVDALYTRFMTFDPRSSPDLSLVTSTSTTSTLAVTGFASMIGQKDIYFSTGVLASGGTAPYSYAVVSGSLPSGVSLGSDGSIKGTPTATSSGSVTIRVTDSLSNTVDFVMSIVINASPIPSVTTPPAGLFPILSGFTFSNNSPSAGSVAWSSGSVWYKGTSYSVSSGNTANGLIYWVASSPTAFGSASISSWPPTQLPNIGVEGFIVGVNMFSSSGASQGYFGLAWDIHSNADDSRLILAGDQVAAYNSGRFLMWCGRRTNANPTGVGIIECFDGAGNAPKVRLRGDSTASTVDELQAVHLTLTASNSQALNFANFIAGGSGRTFQGYIPIQIGGVTYYLETFQ